jgi:predicted metal-dependent hydrolase
MSEVQSQVEGGSIRYGSHQIDFTVVRRERTTVEIAVEPDATVTVAVPIGASVEVVNQVVRKRAAWVLRQQRDFLQFRPRTPERQFVAGETHRYLGRRYRLKVTIAGSAGESVKMSRGFIVVCSSDPSQPEQTRELVNQWYLERARGKFSERLEVNLLRFADPEAPRPNSLVVQELRQRWGSMSPGGRLLLNRRLVEASTEAIDYVITHELCHRLQANHSGDFWRLLEVVMPDWRRRKHRLEEFMA